MIALQIIGIMLAIFAGGLVVLFGIYCLGMVLERWAMYDWIRTKGDKVQEEKEKLEAHYAVHEEIIPKANDMLEV